MLISTAQAQPFGGATGEGGGRPHDEIEWIGWVVMVVLIVALIWSLVGGIRR